MYFSEMTANARAGTKPEFLQDDGYETGVAVNGLQTNQIPGAANSTLPPPPSHHDTPSKQTTQRRGRAPTSKYVITTQPLLFFLFCIQF